MKKELKDKLEKLERDHPKIYDWIQKKVKEGKLDKNTLDTTGASWSSSVLTREIRKIFYEEKYYIFYNVNTLYPVNHPDNVFCGVDGKRILQGDTCAVGEGSNILLGTYERECKETLMFKVEYPNYGTHKRIIYKRKIHEQIIKLS